MRGRARRNAVLACGVTAAVGVLAACGGGSKPAASEPSASTLAERLEAKAVAHAKTVRLDQPVVLDGHVEPAVTVTFEALSASEPDGQPALKVTLRAVNSSSRDGSIGDLGLLCGRGLPTYSYYGGSTFQIGGARVLAHSSVDGTLFLLPPGGVSGEIGSWKSCDLAYVVDSPLPVGPMVRIRVPTQTVAELLAEEQNP